MTDDTSGCYLATCEYVRQRGETDRSSSASGSHRFFARTRVLFLSVFRYLSHSAQAVHQGLITEYTRVWPRPSSNCYMYMMIVDVLIIIRLLVVVLRLVGRKGELPPFCPAPRTLRSSYHSL